MKPGLAMKVGQHKDRHVFIHTVIGVAIGYFLLHPITMVIYWFQTNEISVTFQNVTEAFNKAFIHAFYLHMMPMSLAFIIIGGIIGLSSGLYLRVILNQGRKLQIQQNHLSESIKSIIKNGENENVEFKKSFRYDYRIGHLEKSNEDIVMRSVAGFLNMKGGILIIGVDMDGHINGLTDDYFSLGRKSREGFEKRFMEVLTAKLGIDICSSVHLAFHEIANTEICSLLIEKAHRPVYLNEGVNTTFYLRIGNSTKPLTTMETVEYLKNSESKNHF